MHFAKQSLCFAFVNFLVSLQNMTLMKVRGSKERWELGGPISADADLFHYDINTTNKNTETVLEVSKKFRVWK
jgi:hypothetical protein